MSRRSGAIFGVVLLTVVGALLADTVLVPRVELVEVAPREYTLDAELSPRVVGRVRHAVLPGVCTATSEPRTERDGAVYRWQMAFECHRQLGRLDEIYLPWQVDGVQMTARWEDGDSQRRLFGREGPGILIPLNLLISRSESLGAQVDRYSVPGLVHFFARWQHLLLAVVLVLLVPVRRLVPSLAAITAGHAGALALADVGLVGLPAAPAEAVVAVAALVLAASALTRRIGAEVMVIGAFVGVLHGLGVATELAGTPGVGGNLVTALFLTLLGVDLAMWGTGLGLSVVRKAVAGCAVAEGGAEAAYFSASRPPRRAVSWGVGIGSAFTLFAVLHPAFVPVRPAIAEGSTLAAPPAAVSGRASVAGIPTQLTATGQLARPLMSYLTVEPFQVRHEVLASVAALRSWLAVPVDETGMIPPDGQEELLRQAADLVVSRTRLAVDGLAMEATDRSASFVTVEATGVFTRERPIPESATDAVLGIVLVFETHGLPDLVEMELNVFSDLVGAVPATLTDPAASSEIEIQAGGPGLEWRNTLGGYTLPTVDAVEAERPRLPLISVGLFVLAALILLSGARRRRYRDGGRRLARVATLLLVAAYVLYPFARVSAEIPLLSRARLTEESAQQVLESLLVNVYRSFDIHSEEAVYDRLALTVTGEQLRDVYLESRKALELENRGGARVRIDEVVVRTVRSVSRTADGGYEIDALWTVGGSVTHFGHEHFRQNRYDALVTIVPFEGTWKIQGLELIEERRLM